MTGFQVYINLSTYNHHHTVQVATEKDSPLTMHRTLHKITTTYVYTTTTTQCKLQRVKTILGTSRSKMQQPIAACTRAQTLTRPCPCATCIWLLHPAPTSAQDGLDSLQLVLVVFFLSSFSAKTSLALAVGTSCNLHQLQFALVVFILYQLAHLLMCTRLVTVLPLPLQLALVVFFLNQPGIY